MVAGTRALAGLLLLLLAGLWSRATGGMLVAQFPAPKDPPLHFSHLAIDRQTGQLYAAATNHLLQLDGDLRLLHIVTTGPRNDSPLCHATGCQGKDITTSLMDNYNKILVIEPDKHMLISCGSLSQGACNKYKLNNITADSEFIPISIAANDEVASTFAYIGPRNYNPWSRPDVLYVGTTFTNNGEYRHDVPAIASRDLDTLEIAEYSFSKQSLLNIDVKYRDHFLVQYIYGFNASDYAYFVIVQKQSHLPGQEEMGYVTRLARICVNDANYDSYTEVTLQCADGDQKYNLIQDAKLATAGIELASSLGVPAGSPVLVAAFRPARGITNEPQSYSALCLYPLRDIETKFNENIHMCFNGSVKYRNMGYVSGPINDGKCPTAGNAGNILNFCEAGLKISGVTPIVTNPLLVFNNTSISSVVTASTGRHVLAFLGTHKGQIKKVLLSGAEPVEYEEVTVDAGHTILPDTALSPSGEFLYVLSSSKVNVHSLQVTFLVSLYFQISKLKVEHCSSYSNCSACLESKDPYCGWCSLEKR